MKTIFFGLVILSFFSCNEDLEHKFSLHGKTASNINGLTLYLQNPITGDIMDSTTVENNQFSFQTKLPRTPFHARLSTIPHSIYTVRRLWLENDSMTFDASKSDFRNALVTGSESENLSQDLFKQIDTLYTFKEMENA